LGNAGGFALKHYVFGNTKPDLIIEIKIEHEKKSDSPREERDDFEEFTICLLRQDGTFETLDSCRH